MAAMAIAMRADLGHFALADERQEHGSTSSWVAPDLSLASWIELPWSSMVSIASTVGIGCLLVAMREKFDHAARWVARQAGRPAAFVLAAGLVLAWLQAGRSWGGRTPSTLINIGTTIITF